MLYTDQRQNPESNECSHDNLIECVNAAGQVAVVCRDCGEILTK